MPEDPERPEYKVYRARPRLLGGGARTPAAEPRDPLRELREQRPGRDGRDRDGGPGYEVHRAGGGRGFPRLPRRGPRSPLSIGRIVRWALTAALAWVLLSAVVFMVSAQLRQGDLSGDVSRALDGGGYTLTSPNNILVLGSDARTKKTAEPGSTVGGPSRSDSILLVRTGGGASSRLSIPRDTIVDIPGHGRNKINAAFAIGGPPLAIQTIQDYLGIEIHHVAEVDFENFPELIDALGGIDIRTSCVISRINGGYRNGGFTLRLPGGESHIDGDEALALARTRKNECNPQEDDLTRARRQQKIFAAIKDRVLSPATFVRLPWVAWEAPGAVRTDMAGPSLLGLFGAIAIGGTPETRVLKPSGGATLPDGGAGLVVSDADRAAAVERFLDG